MVGFTSARSTSLSVGLTMVTPPWPISVFVLSTKREMVGVGKVGSLGVVSGAGVGDCCWTGLGGIVMVTGAGGCGAGPGGWALGVSTGVGGDCGGGDIGGGDGGGGIGGLSGMGGGDGGGRTSLNWNQMTEGFPRLLK